MKLIKILCSTTLVSPLTEDCPDFRAPLSKKPRRDFFDVLRTAEQMSQEEDEVTKYLSEGVKETNSILKFPILHQLYLRHNTGLPSSASVERLFSTGGLIFKPTRSLLSDEMFECLIFLKCNAKLDL